MHKIIFIQQPPFFIEFSKIPKRSNNCKNFIFLLIVAYSPLTETETPYHSVKLCIFVLLYRLSHMQKKAKAAKINWFYNYSKLTGFIVGVFVMILVLIMAYQRAQVNKVRQAQAMDIFLEDTVRDIQYTLQNCYHLALTQAMLINDEGIPENYEQFGRELIQNNTFIKAVQLAPDGIIKFIYPLEANQAALGINLLHHPHREEALKSIQQKKYYFAGPFNLVQGGKGIAVRLPVFIQDKFWGFSVIIIDADDFFDTIGLQQIEKSPYEIDIRTIDPLTHEPIAVFHTPDHFEGKHTISSTIKEGNWTVVAAEKEVAYFLIDQMALIGIGIIVSLTSGFLTYNLLHQPVEAMRLSNNRFESLFKDSPIALFEEDFSQVKIYLSELGLVGKDPTEVNRYFTDHPEVVNRCAEMVKILDVNYECLYLHYPKTREEIINNQLSGILDPDSRQSFINQLLAVTSQVPKITMDTYIVRPNGDRLDMYLQWSVMRGYEDTLERIIVSTEDVTKRKQAEKEALNSKMRMRSLIDTIDGIVWEADYATDRYIYVNEKAEKMTGFAIEEWLTTPNFWQDRLHPDQRDQMIEEYYHKVATKEQFEMEYQFSKSNGQYIYMRDNIIVIRDANGSPTLVRGIKMDITQAKAHEDQLNESLALVIEQNKRLQNFSYIVSHNLRSHTSNIQSIAQLMLQATPDEQAQMVTMLQTVAHSLNDAMTNLNEVINIQKNLNLSQDIIVVINTINNALAAVSEQISLKNAEIICEVPEEATVKFNAAYFDSIVLNLISNALRYSDPKRAPLIRIDWNDYPTYSHLSVQDNGIGINLQKHAHELFGMYKTFSRNPDSKGIGLFITKNQIEALGGRITIESKPNQGTTFHVYFPKSADGIPPQIGRDIIHRPFETIS